MSKKLFNSLAVTLLGALAIVTAATASAPASLSAKHSQNVVAGQRTATAPAATPVTAKTMATMKATSSAMTRQSARTMAVAKATPAATKLAAIRPAEVSSTYWWGSQTWYSRADVRAYASWWGVLSIAQRVCTWGPWWMQAGCKRTVGAYTSWIYNAWMHAKNTNQCLTMKMLWTGQVIGINAYGCNWG